MPEPPNNRIGAAQRAGRVVVRPSLARDGFSLLEMIAATALVAGTLAPALAVMRDAMAISREGARRQLLANYAVQVLESQAALVMQNWANGSASGNFATDGYTTIRYTVSKSDAPADGGLTDQLMHIQVTTYEDADGDSVADADEIQTSFRTKIAKLASYENAPN
jgi:type II secretory pathway pseudopilin PulG